MASPLTRRALRVYAALNQLRRGSDDVLEALLPFFEPILAVLNGKAFDPRVFAAGVQKLYHWRFTPDIAEHFIPRLQKAGYLEQVAKGKNAIYVVRFENAEASGSDPEYTTFLPQIIDEFEAFTPRLNDLLNYNRTREDLTDILIRFLVSLDAYNPASFSDELRKLAADDTGADVLSKLEEGARALSSDDRYIAARFVQRISSDKPETIPHLARLASIGLLTEVVEDFMMPVQSENSVALSVVVDAPLALDYLGCSGTALKNDVRSIFDALRKIGCRFVVFPVTCEEMQRNLQSMLSKPLNLRHGYTHDAILKREVSIDFVKAVASDPQAALEKAGIQVRSMTLSQMPSLARYFTEAQYEDFFASISWVNDVHPREHDATCLALTLRLREGKHHSDVFKCGYVFVTRNPTFVKHSRAYCLESRLMNRLQEGAVIHQRHLATLAWLRTGLGVDDVIPRGHLLATCDRVLRVRPEVRDAVAEKLKEVTPESLEQFELLVSDARSMRRLADMTLNNEKIVTGENVPELLEAMRQATIEEEKKQFESRLESEQAKHKEAMRKQRTLTRSQQEEADRISQELELAQAQIAGRHEADVSRVEGIASDTTRTVGRVGALVLFVVALAIGAAILNSLTGRLERNTLWLAFTFYVVGLLSLYHLVMDFLQRPKIGVRSVLSFLSARLFWIKVKRAGLEHLPGLEKTTFDNGKVCLPVGLVKPGRRTGS
jgi:hypothetical protein